MARVKLSGLLFALNGMSVSTEDSADCPYLTECLGAAVMALPSRPDAPTLSPWPLINATEANERERSKPFLQ
jgi:hypothetical protein